MSNRFAVHRLLPVLLAVGAVALLPAAGASGYSFADRVWYASGDFNMCDNCITTVHVQAWSTASSNQPPRAMSVMPAAHSSGGGCLERLIEANNPSFTSGGYWYVAYRMTLDLNPVCTPVPLRFIWTRQYGTGP
jgi:hypothetical protein